ncbi:MAG TPA: SusD/RagB family nutrient-binding outer membrane lipoprotein, partial [Chitinophagaceae bacterium]|nr:SusD/RagB family nutrient-binding outer membrane lipoprotein [Chitinophagaceae bacterium]
MKKYIIVIVMGCSMILSCKKILDVNTDPDNANQSQATPQLIFPAAVASSAGRIGGDLAILGGIWAQHYTQNTTSSQYRAIDAFNLSKTDFGATTISSPWAELYSGALNDLNFIIKKSEEQKNWNYFLMGTVIKAYTLQALVDLYDQVPYTEAFQGASNLTPRFDDGYTVYTGLLAEIDAALEKDFGASTNAPAGNADFIFPAAATTWVIDPWIKFANTLKLKMYMRMVYAKPAEAEAGIKAMYTNGAEFLDQDAKMDVFEDAPDKSNPFYEFNFRKLNTDANLKASYTFLSWLEQNGDPRVDNYFMPKTGGTPTQFLAIHQGDYLNTDATFNSASKAN